MTGVELALAIVPLVIAGVEHHRTVIRKTKALASSKSKNQQLLEFYQEIYAELSLLQNTLDRVKVRSTLKATKRSENGGRGVREKMSDSIHQVLGSTAQPFEKILERILKSIDDIVSNRSVALSNADMEHPNGVLSKLERLKTMVDRGEKTGTLCDRLRFTSNEKSRSVAMHRIKSGNENIERLLSGSMDLFEQQSRAHRRRTPPTRTRKLSEALYKKIARTWPKTCSCRIRHEAKLCLWNCCSAQDHDESDDSLDMVISVPDKEQRRPSWQESSILVSGSETPAPKRTVQFDVDDQPLSSPSPPVSPVQDIDSEPLCTLLKKAQTKGTSLSLVFENGKLWQRQSRRIELKIRNQKDIPLTSLLVDDQRDWCLKEKEILAVVLAHAALHCSNGPWLRADWSKEHVSFFMNGSTMEADLKRPFLTVDFDYPPLEGAEEANLFMAHSNPALLSLGIVLLEIFKGNSIESQWAQEDLVDGQPNENTNLTTALRVLEKSNGHFHIGYHKAIQACLKWDVVSRGREHEDMRTRVYEAIVEPLERELEHGFDIKPEHLGLVT